MNAKKVISAVCVATTLAMSLSGCVTKNGKIAMSVAKELMESGSYEAAAEQCAIAIGNGVTDKDFIHMSDVINSYNEALSLYESGKNEEAKKKIYEISDYSDLKIASDIDILREKILDGEINYNGTETAPATAYSDNTVDYSQYDSQLTNAYVSGAETGSVYFWKASTGNGYSTTLKNSTAVQATGKKENGRTLVKYNGKYGWLTTKYLNIGNIAGYDSYYHIEGASAGSVYVWKNSYGEAYYTTIPNGTAVTPTGNAEGGRVEIYWSGGYAWITDDYVR